ncbi:MAG TPA: type II toxin-antitoxin system HicA family toxin [Flavobacterium sp.]|nr:type II toxin-antitoxin system HicA family toxin [Flavobacterium sp.]
MTSTLYSQLVKLLRKQECIFIRQGKGSHEIWYSPITQKNFCVPFTIKSKPTANAILKQAGIAKKL